MLRHQPIARFSDGQDELRRPRIPFQLPPQLPDVRVQRPAQHALVVAPHLAQQLVPRDDSAPPAEECAQLQSAEEECARLQAELEQEKAWRASLLSSSSWKVTAPLRRVAALLGGLRPGGPAGRAAAR